MFFFFNIKKNVARVHGRVPLKFPSFSLCCIRIQLAFWIESWLVSSAVILYNCWPCCMHCVVKQCHCNVEHLHHYCWTSSPCTRTSSLCCSISSYAAEHLLCVVERLYCIFKCVWLWLWFFTVLLLLPLPSISFKVKILVLHRFPLLFLLPQWNYTISYEAIFFT